MPRGIVSVIRASSATEAVAIGTAMAEAGIRNLEVTFTVPDAPAVIRALCERTEAHVGAGTVLSVVQARAATEAGATFIVSPSLEPDVVNYTLRMGFPSVVGALTPTEISRAISSGATAIKIFPVGSVGGPSYVAAVSEVFPDAFWVVSGGIRPDAVQAYRNAGSSSICLGNALIDHDALARNDHEALVAHASDVLSTIGLV